MSNRCLNRITREIKDILTAGAKIEEYIFEVEKDGIYIYIDESDIQHFKTLIIGPAGTPYEDGFYLFDIKISNEYPFKPPSVKFETIDTKIRFNPNFYENGKVCLSVLGTWAGPSWTSSMNIANILQILRMTMTEVPKHNEPGYENDNSTETNNYTEIVRFNNYNFAILYQLNNYQGIFTNVIRNIFKNKKEKILSDLDKLITKYNDKPTLTTSYSSQNAKLDYDKIKKDLQTINSSSSQSS